MFGFYEHVIPERRRSELKEEIKRSVESRMNSKDGSSSRQSRKSTRELKMPSSTTVTDRNGREMKLTLEENSFIQGLVDNCPRCGFSPTNDKFLAIKNKCDTDSLTDHIANCNDKNKHKEYRQKLKLQAERVEKKKRRKQKRKKKHSGLLNLIS